MNYRGSCHCGKVRFEVEGDIRQLIECNCSHCSRKGYLLWFTDTSKLQISDSESALATYLFNRHHIRHQFCSSCGCAPFGLGQGTGAGKAAINVRCLEDFDFKTVPVKQVDGRSL